MEFIVKEPMKIADGKHTGIISGVEYRTKPYEYTDLVLEFESGKRIKTGAPSVITTESQLGKLMIEFGAKLEIGKSMNPEEIFKNRACSFMTVTKGQWPEVVKGSLKLVE